MTWRLETNGLLEGRFVELTEAIVYVGKYYDGVSLHEVEADERLEGTLPSGARIVLRRADDSHVEQLASLDEIRDAARCWARGDA